MRENELPQSKPDGFASSLGEGAFGITAKFAVKLQTFRVCSLPLGGAVAQRLRGFKSAEPEKTVKRSSRRTGVNLQFFPVQPSSLGLKGASSPFFVAPARRNRWWFSGSLLPPKENIPPAASRMVTASSARPDSGCSRAGSAPKTSRPPGIAWPAARRAAA